MERVETFRQRARFEADRYGENPWVFVRELLQNARDAGAGRVWLTVDRRAGVERISCRDDGCGMTFEHARRYLFTLYATSKRDQPGTAGRFGIGFWSVLRFAPEAITVRSRPTDGDGWEVCLDGALETAAVSGCVMLPGTEVVLERPVGAHDLTHKVLETVREDARFLRRRDGSDGPLEVTVNGEPVTIELELDPPSVTFRRPGLRGAVALAAEPLVEVFAHGLRVRTAAFLDELTLVEARRSRPQAELPDGLVPRIVLDSGRLEVLMARSDAREDRALRRMIALARRELDLLVGSVLDRRAPRARLLRAADRIVTGVARRPVRWGLAALLVGGALGAAIGLVLGDAVPGLLTAAAAPQAHVMSGDERPYEDLGLRYRGPSVDALDVAGSVALRYRPETASPLISVLLLSGLDAQGLPAEELPEAVLLYRGAPCLQECLDIELEIATSPGLLRLPVATGHRIDPDSVELEGEPQRLLVTDAGEPALEMAEAARGTLHYRSGPTPAAGLPRPGAWPDLPEPLDDAAEALLAFPVPERVAAALELVRSRVAYDRSVEVADAHRRQRTRGASLFARALDIGAGDCDVQNALLAAVLDRSAVPVRLAVGFVGRDGRALPGLHAWVEYLDRGAWWAADASAPSAVPSSRGAPVTVRGVPVDRGSPGAAAVRAVRSPTGSLPLIAAAAGVAGAILLLMVVALRSRIRRTVRADGGADLARLLRGALLRPEAYGEVGSLYGRPLVPMTAGRPASLHRLRRLARAGRLYRSDRGAELARAACKRGFAVIDASREEGRVVADLLGARDLDVWNGVLERSRSTTVTDLVERALAEQGERWMVRVATGAPGPVAAIEGGPLGVGARGWVAVIDESSRLWRTIERARDRLDWAALVVGDGVTQVAELAPARRRRVLAELARRALAEAAP